MKKIIMCLVSLLVMAAAMGPARAQQTPTEYNFLTIGVNDAERGSVEMLIGTVWDSITWKTWQPGNSTDNPVFNQTSGNVTISETAPNSWSAYTGVNGSYGLTIRTTPSYPAPFVLTSNTANFRRIEFLMTKEYYDGEEGYFNNQFYLKNPNIAPLDGWTFSGKKAVWQGNAASITMTSCSTYVNQIVFTREGDSSLVQTTANADVYSIVSGSELNIRATANTGYHLSGWSNGFPINASQTARVNVTCDTTVRAIFDTNEYVLTVAVANGQDAMGVVSGSNPAAKHFYNYTITATPNDGYRFSQWQDGDTNATRSVTLTENTTYKASFVVDTFTLTVAVTPDQAGTVVLQPLPAGVVDNGDGTYRVPYLTEVVAQAVPAEHYDVLGWSDGRMSANKLLDTIVMGATDATLTATFSLATYTITLVNATVQPPMPTAVTDNGDSTYTAPYGTEMIIVPIVPEYMRFDFWSGEMNFDNPRTVTFDQNKTYTAIIGWQYYTVFTARNDTNMGIVSHTYKYGYYGQVMNFSATPKPGYNFVNWTDVEGDSVYSTEAEIEVTILGANRHICANFAPIPYTVTFVDGTEDVGKWSFSPAAAATTGVAEGSVVTISYNGSRRVKSIEAMVDGTVSLTTPLTLEALTAGTIVVQGPQSGMQYTLNGGAKTAVTSDAINVSVGDKVAFYGDGTSITTYSDTKITGGTAEVKVYGNIMSLVDEENFATATTLTANYQFCYLFGNNDHLKDASGLLLPATTLTEGCYNNMFYHCTSLTAAPALPATTLAEGCYYCMFSGCTSLTTAPAELPATTLAQSCYSFMFFSCSALTTVPELPAQTLVDNCYYYMFYNCSNLNSVTCLATSGINQNSSTTSWLSNAGNNVTGTKTFNAVSTVEWPTNSNSGIPSGWTRQNIDN